MAMSEKDPEKAQLPAIATRDLDLDQGKERVRFKQRWYQIWRPRNPPPPPPASLDEAKVIPIVNASFLSILTYSWLNPIMVLGYQRALQASDLWKMDHSRESEPLSAKLDRAWAKRCKDAEEWNARLEQGLIQPSFFQKAKWRAIQLTRGRSIEESEETWKTKDGKKEPSLAWSLNDTFGWHFWLGGAYKVAGDTSQMMGPLIIKQIIIFSRQTYAAHDAGRTPPNIGLGVIMALGLLIITVVTSLCQHQFFYRSMSTGVLARAALISSIYKRGLALTPQARTKHSGAALMNNVSTDVSRIDYCAQWYHAVWTAPIQVAICLAILLTQLGPSALAGFALFGLLLPVQERAMAYQLKVRGQSMKWTDERAKLIQELLSAMRVIKVFCYEIPFLKRIADLRRMELKGVRKILVVRSANVAVAFSIPVISAIIAFIAYSLSGHPFDSAIIFPSLSLFALIRQPLMFLPRALSSITDAQNALSRLKLIFLADQRQEGAKGGMHIDKELDFALRVEKASFQWEKASPDERKGDRKGENKDKKLHPPQSIHDPGSEASSQFGQEPFSLHDINLDIPRGQLVAFVGRVGSGKSSLFSGLIGEMTRLSGRVTFGGNVALCSQLAWIQNASLRENVLFGRPFEEERYWQAIRDASLLPDLELLPDGDLTEIGEKGINLSGGQKQRVNIARALYFDADIIALDDPLSAVDAHVGRALFNNAIIKALKSRGKTVLLVTHALHFLPSPEVDRIYTIVNGRIEEQGSFQELMRRKGGFERLMKEFGGDAVAADEEEREEEQLEANGPSEGELEAKSKSKALKALEVGRAAGIGRIEGRLMKREIRTIGSISNSVYWGYLIAARGMITGPLVILAAIIMQGSQAMTTYVLVWWEANQFSWSNNAYMGLYAGLGVSQAVFTFIMGAFMAIQSYFASSQMHHDVVHQVFHAPMSFFDTTPLGRILGVFGKDIDTIDNMLAESLRMFVLTVTTAIGSVIIITYLEYYFIAAVLLVALLYNYFAMFYRESARELKRLDSSLRSLLYSHFSESLSGLATIHAYGVTDRFLKEDNFLIDLENRALYLTITNQRWLAVRLDSLGALLVFAVAMMTVAAVNGMTPAQVGLVLTWTTSLVQIFGMVTRMSAEVENYMNAVERVFQYTKIEHISQEAPHEIASTKPPSEWPKEGSIDFQKIVMSYRPDLAPVLKGISMSVRGGEKIGVVGRTGAGKSSLLSALFRLTELSSGSIIIGGLDIAKLGLRDLRSKISIIPQEPILFSGTIRSNLDPFSIYDDSRLHDALRRSHLVQDLHTDPEFQPAPAPSEDANGSSSDHYVGGPMQRASTTRFTLETPIVAEGANLSVGERSLLSLARALVKDSKIIVLDEASASVDLETDSKIQHTILTEFADKTLLCIAHRLRTILSYDRVCVMDSGMIVELGTPEELFLTEQGVFRSMCDGSGIGLEEIRAAKGVRAGVGASAASPEPL